ncbi:glycosyltransferase [Commensalibacter papalotli (ex Botero et al. 2024)]|uniref:Glycosyltransferase involved in cell wall bisynthesis (RfaB) (PDB:2IV7) n=1 Tax=Commensalibacter papalotli (ex Botero et al. 2024) TaxID=2972766 RepID=A0ABN8W3M4_9PROT|nr:glycosyltransferase [Commensalibacter papalotli (ex Botero et al. 2024)]CAI3930448.1 Glycosyltransferase involved in cell wall bisynthesis (RfaB) (PDB:2IV7) [Commensalibacter papalotli (ex Botero et al. 2024)]CAI3948194.1 Glycosyltransferase involved in cell wall bisynthesis (RfaB) (PDB:2IV7) [Commensalibacter papalotli (ex Botero et al. 2024)]
MSQKPKIRLKEYTKKKAEGLERIRQSAQSAFVRAQDEKTRGNIQEAARWMDRAHRLAEYNPNITFDLVMLKLKLRQYDDAYSLLVPLMKKFDFYEGWLVLAILLAHKKELSQSIEQLHYALSRYCPTNKTWGMIREIIRSAGKEGCCGLIGSVGQVWVDNRHRKHVSVFLDNECIFETLDPFFSLPPGWEGYSYLHVEIEDTPLVGSPIDIQAILRTEGFVENDDKFVKGWLWYPAEPDRIPTIYVTDEYGKFYKELQAIKEFDVATLEFPLFRAKQFFIPIDEFLFGLYRFQDDYGQNLIGSPIDPLVLRNKSSRLRDIKKKHQNYIPVSAYYKGSHPEIADDQGVRVVVIIPVYKGFYETIACVESVLKTLPKEFVIQLVNDCSPDIELIEWLELKVNHESIFLIHHLENLGFPGAVNTGIQAWPGYDVILLNSDTLVAKGWADCLHKAAYSEENIGTVTPFSNDASIFSYPYHDKVNPIPSLKSVQNLMRYMQKTHQDMVINVPTAHGFCMFIRHDCLSQTGLFRENLFAQGYGEENDFCMRAQHLGWRHVLAAGCFVGHKGGVSFQNSKQALLKRNLGILNKLYPDYDEMVMDYIDKDFLRSVRRKVDLYRLQDLEKKQVKLSKPIQYALFITHTYGGGVERAVQERANELRLKGVTPLFIRPTLLGDACQLEIQLKSPSFQNVDIEELYPNFKFNLPSEYDDLLVFLKNRSVLYMQVHHFAGHHVMIRNLLQDLKIEYEMYVHDYMSFCPRISLINKQEVYCGEPNDLTKCQICIGKELFDESEPIHMQKWIDRSEKELQDAKLIIAPSQDTANRIYRHFSSIKEIQIQNLEDDRPDLSVEQLSYFSQICNQNQNSQLTTSSKRFKVCFIGAIGIEKGFNIVHQLVKDADQRDLPLEFSLVGRTVDDRLFEKTDRLFITGTYQEEEAISLVKQQNADIAFFPAIWPETWCYALSLAWRSGLETVAFDFGAIAQRIKNTQRGWILSSLMAIPEQNDMLLNLCKKVRYKKDNR